MTIPAAATLVEMLQRQAERLGDKVAFRFCPDGDDDERDRLTYRELDSRARALAGILQRHGAAGQRVLIFCRPGLDSIVGFFGCLYARAVAVPVDEQWTSERIAAIVPDARADFALATAKTQAKVGVDVNAAAGERPLHWLTLDAPDVLGADPESWSLPRISGDTVAAIQYTSGTTRAPKGVLLSHANFMHNLALIAATWNAAPDDPALHQEVGCVSWLPQFHDLGLIGGVLTTLYVGTSTVLMSPGSFLLRPIRWLEAMSRFGAVITAAPNFAYDWCVRRSTPEQRAALDLSKWRIALSGGEPVNPATLQAFSETFAPAGFRSAAFLPVYGLAEATLGVSGGASAAEPTVVPFDRDALGADRVAEVAPGDPGAVELVGCGPPRGGQQVLIVDPETRLALDDDGVGEIWIAGASVGQGYWRRPEETEQIYGARLADTGAGPYLRTGDRGFAHGGELFIPGRVKDLVVIRDVNHYPSDIERTVQACDPALLPGRGAAFAVQLHQTAAEQLVVVQEVHRHHTVDLAAVLERVRAAVAAEHRVAPHDVLLVKPMTVPTTTSGKLQRGVCRQRFLDGEIRALAEWHAPPEPVNRRQEAALGLAQFVGRLVRKSRGEASQQP